MSDLLIVLDANDLPAAAQLVAQRGKMPVWVFDPTLFDKVRAAGLEPSLAPGWPEAPPYSERVEAAHALARRLGRQLDAVSEPLWPGLRLGSWQHLSLYYLHQALAWHSGVFEATLDRLPAGSLHVPFTDQPQTYYFPSFIPALMLLLAAQRRGRPFQAYTHSRRTEDPQPVPDLEGEYGGDGRPLILAHLPTCFYDASYIQAELAASGSAVLDIRARYWHVAAGTGPAVGLAPADRLHATLDPALQQRIGAVLSVLERPLDEHLATWITAPAFRRRQVDQLLAVYRAQLVTLALLQRHFARQAPSRLLLSDHDTDFHGPLAAHARQTGVPLVVLPHSKASTDLEFVARNAQVLHHAIQGDAVLDVDGLPPAQAVVDLPVELRFGTQAPGPVRRLGLLLNGVALNGVACADLEPYAAGLRRIVAWCATQGLELIVRSRPGQTLFGALLEGAGLSPAQLAASVQGSMADFAQACDLCLMYDGPTTGALELLSRGVPTLNPVAGTLTKRETAVMHTDIVPRASVTDCLRQAEKLLQHPRELHDFRRRQFLAFVERLRGARPLRDFL